MNDASVFQTVSGALIEYLRTELSPALLSSPDAVRLAYPGSEDEFRLGVSLYDVEEIRSGGPSAMVRLSDEERRFPSLAVALHFLVFANRKAAFHGIEAEDELLLLEAVMRCVHSAPSLTCGETAFHLLFQNLDCGEKTSLWQSLNCPLQPAVYLTVEPVGVPSTRLLHTPAVRGVDVETHWKGDGK